ncbi:MAG: helix-turn-helix transcriptional regulator [Proteobacteria bacterium]|nr:helix-turn-helix transcriptional regulator [Pseudomonadota bacterium]
MKIIPVLLGKTLPKNHISITAAQHMLELSKELFQRYGITGFVHARLYNDSSRFTLTTCPEWYSHFIEQGYFNYSRLDRHASCYESGYFLWDAWDKNCPGYQIVVKDAEENFDGGRGISVIKKSDEWVDKYEFSSGKFNYSINQFFLSNINLLEDFIDFYKEKAAKLIEEAHKNRNYLPYKIDVYSEYSDTLLPVNIIGAAAGVDTAIDKQNPIFTKRELECIHWLSKGKTIPELAAILGRSSRTCEKFILNIKEKLNCCTFFQLGMKVSEIGLTKLLGNL